MAKGKKGKKTSVSTKLDKGKNIKGSVAGGSGKGLYK
jgi:hypothetical protein